MGKYKPQARSNRLLRRVVGDEIVLYDLDTDEAHLLTPVAATVWDLCDGTRTVDAITRDVAGALPPISTDAVGPALAELRRLGLLVAQGGARGASGASGFDRRRFLKAASAVAVAAPLITTILAPTPAAAGSLCTSRSTDEGGGVQCDPCVPAPAGEGNEGCGPRCCASNGGRLVCCSNSSKCKRTLGTSCTGNSECCSNNCSKTNVCAP